MQLYNLFMFSICSCFSEDLQQVVQLRWSHPGLRPLLCSYNVVMTLARGHAYYNQTSLVWLFDWFLNQGKHQWTQETFSTTDISSCHRRKSSSEINFFNNCSFPLTAPVGRSSEPECTRTLEVAYINGMQSFLMLSITPVLLLLSLYNMCAVN